MKALCFYPQLFPVVAVYNIVTALCVCAELFPVVAAYIIVRVLCVRTVVSCGPSISFTGAEASAPSGTYGDVVTYTCATGYSQSGGGTGTRICSVFGIWVVDGGDSDPVCTGWSTFDFL